MATGSELGLAVRLVPVLGSRTLLLLSSLFSSSSSCYLFNIGIDELEEGVNYGHETQEEAHQETLVRQDDCPAASTPSRVRNVQEPAESQICKRVVREIAVLSRVANVPAWLKKPKDPRFIEGAPRCYKFVDDNVNINKVNMRKATMLERDVQLFKEIIDSKSQCLFEHIASKANERGMAINAEKTGLMLVSAATSFEAKARLKLGGQTVLSSDCLKMLGVTLDKDMSFKTHIEKMGK